MHLARIRFLEQRFLPKVRKRWEQVHRSRQTFFVRFARWIDDTCVIKLEEYERRSESDAEEPDTSSSGVRGRPRRTFSKSAPRTQRAKVSKLREEFDLELLRKASKPDRYAPEEALALLLDLPSKYQYQHLRMLAKAKGSDIYPIYNEVRAMKKQCYPDSINITETSASVKLEELLSHTADRCGLLG